MQTPSQEDVYHARQLGKNPYALEVQIVTNATGAQMRHTRDGTREAHSQEHQRRGDATGSREERALLAVVRIRRPEMRLRAVGEDLPYPGR